MLVNIVGRICFPTLLLKKRIPLKKKICMFHVEEARSYSCNANIEKRAAALRLARTTLEDKKAVCIQLEASLIELANENDATERVLMQKEQDIMSRRSVLEQINTQCNARRNSLEGERKKAAIDAERMESALDNAWHGLEEDIEAAELEHHQSLNRIQQQLEDLRKQENDLVENLRRLHDAELGVENQLRQLKQREDQLKSLSETTLRHLRAELREREGLLTQ